MYSRRKGKSKSTKPIKKVKPSWLRYQKEEVEQLILKLAKAGKAKSEIGIILRDAYGIPDVKVIIGKKLGMFLKEQNLQKELPDDLADLIRREIILSKHLELHRLDQTARRGLDLTESKINRLVKYHKARGRLPESWKYDREKAKLLIS